MTVLISGCRNQNGIRGYWADKSLDYDDYDAAEEQFLQFAERAVQAPKADAYDAIDRLLKKASKDTVTYLVYANFIQNAFGLLASPCHDCDILLHAADNAFSNGLLTQYATENYQVLVNFCRYNQVGQPAQIPELFNGDGTAFDLPLVQRTLLLVVDQNCPSCRESMQQFMTPEWSDTWLVALCYGKGPLPVQPGWDCYKIPQDQTILDTRQAPYFFVTAADGTIEQSYEQIH